LRRNTSVACKFNQMKPIQSVFFVAFLALLTSCASTVDFPVSSTVPAATITASKAKQGTSNYLITLKALNLASPDRLTPAQEIYVIWAVSATGVTRNVGHFTNKNAVTSIYKASFPYEPAEIIITTEEEEGACQPVGLEISRVKLK